MYKVWNGTTWVTRDYPRVYDGTTWKRIRPHYFDGVDWMPTSVLAGSVTASVNLLWDVAAPTPAGSWHTATKSFSASWAGSYRSDGSKRGDTDLLMQGYYSSTNGNQRSLCGFSISGIPSGAEVTDAKLILNAGWWYYNDGGTAVIGTHNKTSEPSTYSSSGVDTDRFRATWTSKTGSKTIDFSNAIGQDFADGDAKGFVFGPGPTTSLNYYGGFVGAGSDRPVLRLTYKWFA